ncbi:MAG: YaaL family protein [Limosilactobacillus gorillae]|uniref:YaaL family protein n=1 Tax=Limosilactobacillus gorillae TaxID=1450649 RepID=UPI000AEDD2A5|nr:YaaL family protein [Limosilactobacillus gorillae]MDO4855556.1 YaaL family protein [Limosilactobacillus gorillae]
MFFKRSQHQVEQAGNQRLLNLIYQTKDSWDHAKETERAVYESDVSNELKERTKLQERKYLYLYDLARKRGLHGKTNTGVIMQ